MVSEEGGSDVWCKVVDRQAIIDSLPLFLGAAPFALVVGLAATESQMPTFIAWLSSPLLFAGAAQLTLLSLAGTVGAVAALSAIAIVNARHMMYSAALSPEFSRHPLWFRCLGAALLIDQNFATGSTMVGVEPASRFRRYYLTSSLFFYINWAWISALGTVIGPAVPPEWRLDFTVPVLFVAMAYTAVKRSAHAVAAIAAAVVGLVSVGLADRLGIVLGAVAGVLAGAIADQLWGASDAEGVAS